MRSKWLLGGFAAAVILMGGGSRYDIASLPFLRAIAVFLAFAVIASAPVAAWRGLRVPLALGFALAVWMAVQLVPLPPEFWSTLPMRSPIYGMDALLGAPDRWRPISMTPAFTWNSMLALFVPIGALLVAGALPSSDKDRIWWILWFCALTSAVFGLLQFIAGPRSAVYLFRITNEGALVGLFANRNHHAILLALGILTAGWLISAEVTRRNPRPFLVPVLIGSSLTFLLLIFAIGSRTGLVCGIGAAVLAYVVGRRSYRSKPQPINQPRGKIRDRQVAEARSARLRRTLAAVIPLVVVGALAALFYLSNRGNAVTRLFESDTVEDGRIQTFAPIFSLVKEQWLLGSGFGSFARVYQIIEPDALLQDAYLNHAHNDWLQLPIEGGLPATLIFLAGIAWVTYRLIGSAREHTWKKGAKLAETWTLAGCFAILAAGSFTDYPLRAPSMAMVAMFLIVILVRQRADVLGADYEMDGART